MEKYTKWRDAGTGVAPFLPVQAPDYTLASLPLRLVTFILKFLLIVIFALVFLLVDTFFRFSLGSVSTAAFETLRAGSARVLLFVCGFYRIPLSYDGRKVRTPKGGDIVVVNHSSPMDILILCYLYPKSVFTQTDTEMLYHSHSAVSAFSASFALTRVRKGVPMSDLQRTSKNRVIVVFPEGTTSNNRGLLALCPLMIDKAFVMSIKYNNPPYLTTPIPGQTWNFVWGLASVVTHGCRLKGSSEQMDGGYADALARLARIPKTNLGVDEKESFLQAWNRR